MNLERILARGIVAGALLFSLGNCSDGSENSNYENGNSNYKSAENCQQPEETFDGFVQAANSGNLEKSLSYFDPQIRSRYSGLLISKGLSVIAEKLQGKSLIDGYQGQNFREYNLDIDSEELPIQFVRMYENGKEVWKIRNF